MGGGRKLANEAASNPGSSADGPRGEAPAVARPFGACPPVLLFFPLVSSSSSSSSCLGSAALSPSPSPRSLLIHAWVAPMFAPPPSSVSPHPCTVRVVPPPPLSPLRPAPPTPPHLSNHASAGSKALVAGQAKGGGKDGLSLTLSAGGRRCFRSSFFFFSCSSVPLYFVLSQGNPR